MRITGDTTAELVRIAVCSGNDFPYKFKNDFDCIITVRFPALVRHVYLARKPDNPVLANHDRRKLPNRPVICLSRSIFFYARIDNRIFTVTSRNKTADTGTKLFSGISIFRLTMPICKSFR